MKIVNIYAKCSDAFTAVLLDNDKVVGEYTGYVPNFLPNRRVQHFGDYVELSIDVETGKIVNWKKPTTKDLSIFQPR